MSQLSSRWAAAGHIVHLITLAALETDAYTLDQRVVRHGLDLMNDSRNIVQGALANVRRVRRLRGQLGKLQPDFILSFCDRMNIVAASAAAGLGKPVWLAEHSDPRKQQLGTLWQRWRKWTYPRATGCVVLTDQIAKWMRTEFPQLTIEVIPPAIAPADNAHSSLDSSDPVTARDEHFRLLTLGRHSPEKNLIGLLRAWRLLIDDFPNWQLIIAGDGPQHAELCDLSSALGLESRVQFTGWLADPWRLLRSCDALVLASHYEGFPVSLLEAMSQGLPCVTAPAGDSVQALAQAGAVELAASTAPSELAAALSKVLSSASRRAQLSTAGRTLSAQYDWSVIGPRWDRLLPRFGESKAS